VGGKFRAQWRALAQTRLSGFCLVLTLLALWEASVAWRWVDSDNWPAFSTVLESFWRGVADGELIEAIWSSLWRMARGYAAGCAFGVVLGVVLATWLAARRALQPLIEFVRPIPAPAVVPPLMFLLGVDDGLKIFVVAFAVFFPVLINTMAGVIAVDVVYRQVALTFGVSPLAALWRVVLPASLPHILAGMRISLALALIVTVVVELIAGSQGIGYYVVSMQFASRAADMYAAIVLLTLVGYALNRAFVAFEARVLHWSRLRETMGVEA
jgi:ABC-type nitrate/sulfonate/bicarbonate transport system permease component